MIINNVCRKTVEDFPFQTDRRDWLISVFSSSGKPVSPSTEFGRVLSLQFDDVEEADEGKVISEDQAAEIAAFVASAEQEGVKTLWVHCDAGICRSGAIVEACLVKGHQTDEEVSNGRVPNRMVFTKVRRAMGLLFSWELANGNENAPSHRTGPA